MAVVVLKFTDAAIFLEWCTLMGYNPEDQWEPDAPFRRGTIFQVRGDAQSEILAELWHDNIVSLGTI